MTLFIAILIAYLALLITIRPTPSSLRAAKPTLYQNFLSVRATLTSGALLLIIFFFTSNYEFLELDRRVYEKFTLQNGHNEHEIWPATIFTHLFLHINLAHLLANVFYIGIASLYERRVGPKRFLVVLIISSLASIPSALFYPQNYAFCGISGGVLGLAAAFFTDHEDISLKEWTQAIVFFTIIFAAISLGEMHKTTRNMSLGLQVDHIGHILGAMAAVLYCRIAPKNAQIDT
jgi:membrane associated rhomboid family serine protease